MLDLYKNLCMIIVSFGIFMVMAIFIIGMADVGVKKVREWVDNFEMRRRK